MAKQSASMLLWNEPWFRKLPAPYKLAWKFLVDHANTCGVVFVDTEYWMFMLGLKDGMSWDKFFEAVGDKIHKLSPTEIWIPQVVNERCGAITWDCRAHRPVIEFLKRYGLTTDQRIHVVKLEPSEGELRELKLHSGNGNDTLSIPYQYPIDRLSIPYRYPIDTLLNEVGGSVSGSSSGVIDGEKASPEPAEKAGKPKRSRRKPAVSDRPPPVFVAPTLEEVKQYCREKNLVVDAEDFFDRYSNTGWYKGGPVDWEPIKNWKNTLLTIHKGNVKEGKTTSDFTVPIREQMAKAKEEQNKPEPRRKPLLGGATA